MAGSSSRALWSWSTRRSSRREDSTSPPRLLPTLPPHRIAAWRSPSVDQRSSPPPAPPAPQLHSRLGSPSLGGGDVPPRRRDVRAIRFATPPPPPSSAGAAHRPWRSATPFLPRSAPPPSDAASPTTGSSITEVHMSYVDMESSRRLAYAFIDPPRADPGHFIWLALERRGGDPPVRLAPSSHSAMMVVFHHSYFRETTVRRGPITWDGHRLSLVHHEEAVFRFVHNYNKLVEISAHNFPPEHHNKDGICEAFQVFGQVCCMDPSCLREVDEERDRGIADYSVVRVLVLLDAGRRITPGLLVRNPQWFPAGIAQLRILGEWDHPRGAPPPTEHDFSSDGGATPPNPDTPPSSRRGLWMGSTAGGRAMPPTSTTGGAGAPLQRVVGALLYPSVPLWSFVSGAVCAMARAMSLSGVPGLVILDLPTPNHPRTPPPAPTLVEITEEEGGTPDHRPVSQPIPSLEELLAEEEHEVSIRHRRARRKRAADSASKIHRSRRLAAKEVPFYMDAVTKASRVKAEKMNIAGASNRMKVALEQAAILERPPPPRIKVSKLKCLGRVCGLGRLSEIDDEEVPTTT
nr:unnamed protein product [Digitaria exilis]